MTTNCQSRGQLSLAAVSWIVSADRLAFAQFISLATPWQTQKRRCSQTKKDALAGYLAKKWLSIYLLGAPRFRIITSHNSLLPLFNKQDKKLPPRIRVMGYGNIRCRFPAHLWTGQRCNVSPRLSIQTPTARDRQACCGESSKVCCHCWPRCSSG